MFRLVEIVLFLTPFALFLAWWLLGTRPAWTAWAALAAVAVLASVLGWLALDHGLRRGEAYAPARIEGGRVVDGHGL